MSTFSWQSPSNIALVKYWGKHGVQLPANPSISFSLGECRTETKLTLRDREEERIKFIFEGKEKPGFLPKMETFLKRVKEQLPWTEDHSFLIESKNTFPHSSGIASSASGMSALALCLAEADSQIKGGEIDFQLASELARLGSGSACRSVYGGFTLWGRTDHLVGSSDCFAMPLKDIHPDFQSLQDTILLIDVGEKPVSSTVGHGLMDGHPFASARFAQAERHIGDMLAILRKGDFIALADLIELEALTLHAMMMSSSPHFMLFRSGSIEVIRKVMELRSTGCPMTFTLDAGANVHLIYPESYAQKAMEIIDSEFRAYCQDGTYICDAIGKGPHSLS